MKNYGWKYGSEPHPRSCAHGMSSAQHRRQRQPAKREEGGAKIRRPGKKMLSIMKIQNVEKTFSHDTKYRKIGVQCWVSVDKSFWFRNFYSFGLKDSMWKWRREFDPAGFKTPIGWYLIKNNGAENSRRPSFVNRTRKLHWKWLGLNRTTNEIWAKTESHLTKL